MDTLNETDLTAGDILQCETYRRPCNQNTNEKPTNQAQATFKAACSETEGSCVEFVKVCMMEFSSENARASFWHIKCNAKSTEQTEPIKQSGQTAESECEQHARKKAPCAKTDRWKETT